MASAIFPYSVAIACITFIVSLLYPLHLPSLPYSYANHFCCCRFIVWLSNSIEYRRRVKCAAIQRTLYKQQQACTLRSHLYVDLNVFRGNASSYSLASFSFNFDSISFSISGKCAHRFVAFVEQYECDFRCKQEFSKLAMHLKRGGHIRIYGGAKVNDCFYFLYTVTLRLNFAPRIYMNWKFRLKLVLDLDLQNGIY